MSCSSAITLISLLSSSAAMAATLQVGPGKTYATPCAAIAAAATGDRIEIDAAGTYSGDVCGWTTSGLTIVGVNGRPKIDANGMSSGGKAIWVVSGDDTTVENVEMSGATVADANGAGIRQEGKNLTVRGCIGSPGVWPAAIRFLERTGIDLSPIQTHSFPLDDAVQALEQGKKLTEAVKVTLEIA